MTLFAARHSIARRMTHSMLSFAFDRPRSPEGRPFYLIASNSRTSPKADMPERKTCTHVLTQYLTAVVLSPDYGITGTLPKHCRLTVTIGFATLSRCLTMHANLILQLLPVS